MPQAGYSWKRDPLLWIYSILMLVPIGIVFFFYDYYHLAWFAYLGWFLLGCSITLIFWQDTSL